MQVQNVSSDIGTQHEVPKSTLVGELELRKKALPLLIQVKGTYGIYTKRNKASETLRSTACVAMKTSSLSVQKPYFVQYVLEK